MADRGASAPFPDFQRAAAALLATVQGLSASKVGGVRPPAEQLKARLPFVATYRIGGSDDGITDSALMVLDVLAETYATGAPLAEKCARALGSAPLVLTLDDKTVVIDTARAPRPAEVPFGDSAVRLWTATYTWSARRQFSLLTP